MEVPGTNVPLSMRRFEGTAFQGPESSCSLSGALLRVIWLRLDLPGRALFRSHLLRRNLPARFAESELSIRRKRRGTISKKP
jgi:hypothetical protein